MKTVRVRLDGEGGMPMPEKVLKSVYVSGMDFEPEERRMRICPDGTVEIQSERTPYMVHAKMTVPLYGQLWVMADNQGEGYRSDFVDFVTEAIRTYIAWARKFGEGIELSVKTKAHLEAAVEFEHLANRGMDTPENRLYALSHAMFAAEGALLEKAREPLGDQMTELAWPWDTVSASVSVTFFWTYWQSTVTSSSGTYMKSGS